MTSEELSDELRNGSSDDLRRRRGIVGLSLVAVGSMGLISLYQMGIIRHLPEPPLPHLDANTVDASPEAYSRFATPDGILGIGSYALTMGLAAMAGKDRAHPAVDTPRPRGEGGVRHIARDSIDGGSGDEAESLLLLVPALRRFHLRHRAARRPGNAGGDPATHRGKSGEDAPREAVQFIPAAIAGEPEGERRALNRPNAAEVVTEWVVGGVIA